ncbi:siderophore-interacting protein [Microbacteriaceae bacterium VKM Ac-2855]|nr:siderophore-interacting protein [Microbacteriaceae bacterium VKM Ac-2855]
MSNIAITHAPSGLVHAEVVRSMYVTPHMVRVTITGPDLERFEYRGFDQWFRLAIPTSDDTRFDRLPDKIDTRGYLAYLMLPRSTRPVIRNYTVRAYRALEREIDIDFVVHGDAGVAAPWSRTVQPGTPVAFIDQGCGYSPVPADRQLLVADETGLPAVAGILRDMPRDSVGDAIIELPDLADVQETDAPEGMTVRWVVRAADARPGTAALETLRALEPPTGTVSAFVVGESGLATGGRRHLVNDRGVPKSNVTFCGYYKLGKH